MKIQNQEFETTILNLTYRETLSFEKACEVLGIELQFLRFDEKIQMNIYKIKYKKGESHFLYNLGKIIQSKLTK